MVPVRANTADKRERTIESTPELNILKKRKHWLKNIFRDMPNPWEGADPKVIDESDLPKLTEASK